MMDTDTLIDRLASDTPPVPRHAASLRLALSLAAGMTVVLVLVAGTLGLRPDLDVAMAGTMFWMKLTYTGSLMLIGIAAVSRLIRPEARPPHWLWLMTVPVALLGFVTAAELATMPQDDRMALWLGLSAGSCSALILLLAVPIGGALMLAVRQFAPTRLRTTGAMIGLAAGGASATLYSLHCPEAGASFVLTWYSLGIALAVAAGALLGPRLLRW